MKPVHQFHSTGKAMGKMLKLYYLFQMKKKKKKCNILSWFVHIGGKKTKPPHNYV